jgi:alkylation response protein AidB-like acyl-CoA dehydrogenase
MEPPPAPAVRPRSKLAGLAAFLIGFAVAIGLAVPVVWWLFWRSGLRLDMSRPTVVQHVQQLQRLETVVYSMEKIVSGSQESPYLPRLLAGDRILLIVYGEVTAGIDLGHLDAEAVRIDGVTVEFAMPASDIFSTRIDNTRTRVYSRETGLFTSPDPNL